MMIITTVLNLIDRFAINVSMPVGTESSRTTFHGIFGLATVDASFRLVNGINCTNGECIDGLASFLCACDLGYTGKFCETRLDGCELQVTFHSFSNPRGACADLCDGDHCENSCCPNRCEYYLSFCQTSIETPDSFVRSVSNGSCFTLKIFPFEYEEQRVFMDTVFGVPNPIIFTGLQWVSAWLLSSVLLYIATQYNNAMYV